ncbi:MAG: prepilin-type N-terminal cleavage/methylation domain-containing protein [Zoogloeaceae bacterium]|jgi:prepilin-type N-terminal cleavage/methylation domain-containing protein|nr:prepilin-type N-terminal cleavage/methylation domain-containing protein [Zoogloeaceae bacterium]
MLSKLMAMTRAELKSKLASIDVSAVKGRSLKRKFEKIRSKKEGGFTLLELLVVVLILAAISGTATIMLQDTDRRGAAGAHVAMMDELSKGIQTYRVLHQGKYPDLWESLLIDSNGATSDREFPGFISSDLIANLEIATINDLNGTVSTYADGYYLTTGGNPGAGNYLSEADRDAAIASSGGTLTASDYTTVADGIVTTNPAADILTALNDVGITSVRNLLNGGVGTTVKDKDGVTDISLEWDCQAANLKKTIKDKENDVVASNIYRPAAANGCGKEANDTLTDDSSVAVWKGGAYRVGVPVGSGNTDPVIIAFGAGPDSTLFNPEEIGALSNVPVYRHVESDEYNHFITLWQFKNGAISFQAIIDGAGDTKDEELGEIDNTRPT